MKHLEITPAIRAALAAIADAEQDYVPGRDSSAVIEIPKLALADALLAAVRAQARIAKLPTRAGGILPVVEVELRRKRRRV